MKQNTIEKGMKNLRSVIGFYRDTTGRLLWFKKTDDLVIMKYHQFCEISTSICPLSPSFPPSSPLPSLSSLSLPSLSLLSPLSVRPSHRNVNYWLHEGGDHSLPDIGRVLWRGHARGRRLCSHHQVGRHSQRYVQCIVLTLLGCRGL